MNTPRRPPPKFPLRLDRLDSTPQRVASSAAPLKNADARVASEVLRPQAPLQHAASASARRQPPTGLGLDSADVRRRMVERLQSEGLKHPLVRAALLEVPRHQFVDAGLVIQAYEDTSLPIGHGQTISKPSVVARMVELLMEGANARAAGSLGRTLEIGTGCGYQAAVLAWLSRQVLSIERLKPLHDKARELLSPLRVQRGFDNIRLVHGDGMRGHPPNAPYDSIISAAGGEALPPAWLDQLAVGGRLVAPVAEPGSDGRMRQKLVVIDRTEQGWSRSVHEGVLFVPLKSGLVR